MLDDRAVLGDRRRSRGRRPKLTKCGFPIAGHVAAVFVLVDDASSSKADRSLTGMRSGSNVIAPMSTSAAMQFTAGATLELHRRAPAAAVSTTRLVAAEQTGPRRDPRQATHAVAAHLGSAAVGVHAASSCSRRRRFPATDVMQTVGADPAVPVAQRRRSRPRRARARPGRPAARGSRSRSRAASRGADRSWAVAVAVGSAHNQRARTARCELADVRPVMPAIRGSRRNHARCRRANRRSAPDRQVERVVEHRGSHRQQVREQLPVADRLACGARQAAGRARGPALRRAGPARASRSNRSAIRVRALSGSTSTPIIVTRQRGSARSRRCPGPNEENGRPVSSITSSARTMRRRLPGSIARRGRRIELASTVRTRAQAVVGFGLRFERGAQRGIRSAGSAGRRPPLGRRGRYRRRAPHACRAPRSRRSRHAPRPASAAPTIPRPDRRRRRDDARPRPRSAASASRCRCRARGTPASSRARPARRRRALARARAPAPTCPTRSGRRCARCRVKPTTTGMRTRRGRADADSLDHLAAQPVRRRAS